MTIPEAAEKKNVKPITISKAIERGAINAVKVGSRWNVLDDRKFADWMPIMDLSERALKRWGW